MVGVPVLLTFTLYINKGQALGATLHAFPYHGKIKKNMCVSFYCSLTEHNIAPWSKIIFDQLKHITLAYTSTICCTPTLLR